MRCSPDCFCACGLEGGRVPQGAGGFKETGKCLVVGVLYCVPRGNQAMHVGPISVAHRALVWCGLWSSSGFNTAIAVVCFESGDAPPRACPFFAPPKKRRKKAAPGFDVHGRTNAAGAWKRRSGEPFGWRYRAISATAPALLYLLHPCSRALLTQSGGFPMGLLPMGKRAASLPLPVGLDPVWPAMLD